MAEIRVSNISGPQQPWRPHWGRAVFLSQIGNLSLGSPFPFSSPTSLAFCVQAVLPPSPSPSFCLAFRRMPEWQPSLTASVTWVDCSLFFSVRCKVKSCLWQFASHSSQCGCWHGSVVGVAEGSFWCIHLHMSSFSSHSTCLGAILPAGPSRKPAQSLPWFPKAWAPPSLTLLPSCTTS